MALPLEVLADLQLAVDGEEIEIHGDGDRIVVDLPSLRAGRRLLTHGPLAMGDREKRIQRVNDALSIAGLTVDIRLQGDVVARIGERARPSSVARALRLGDIEVRPVKPVRAAAQRRPLLTFGIVAGVTALIAWLFFRARND